MSIASIEFLMVLLVLSAIFMRLPLAALRRGLFALCSVAFLAIFIPNLESWGVLVLFLGSGYAAALLLRRSESTASLAIYLVVLVACFACLQRYELVALLGGGDLLAHGVRIIGLSYMLFRQIHFVVDSKQGQIPDATLLGYLSYQLNVFGLLAGPILRYQEFAPFWTEPGRVELDDHKLRLALLRVFVGAIKVAGIAPGCLFAYEKVAGLLLSPQAAGQNPWVALAEFATIFYLYPTYIYFNFAGYCDIVIAGASLIGLPMPENFNRPWRSRNMIDFWNRWHRTLSFWLRDYVFTTMYLGIARRWSTYAKALAPLCLFSALLVAGVWHGSTLNWLLFGVLNGLGVAAAQLWEDRLVARSGRKGLRVYLQNRWIEAVAIFCNLNFVCFTILFFLPDLGRTSALVARVADACEALLGGA